MQSHYHHPKPPLAPRFDVKRHACFQMQGNREKICKEEVRKGAKKSCEATRYCHVSLEVDCQAHSTELITRARTKNDLIIIVVAVEVLTE